MVIYDRALIDFHSAQYIRIICLKKIYKSRVAQWKRAGPITQRSVDRNYALLIIFLFFRDITDIRA